MMDEQQIIIFGSTDFLIVKNVSQITLFFENNIQIIIFL